MGRLPEHSLKPGFQPETKGIIDIRDHIAERERSERQKAIERILEQADKLKW